MITSDPNEKPFRVYTAASIGPAIKHYRKEAGLTQAELAERVGLTREYLFAPGTGPRIRAGPTDSGRT